MTIYLDVDGTILDIRLRYHQLHVELFQSRGWRPMSVRAYWSAKRRAFSERKIALACGFEPEQALLYAQEWSARVEDLDLLRLDHPLRGARHALELLSSCSEVVLVSLRQNRARLLQQLAWWDIGRQLVDVLTADPRGAPRHIKGKLVENHRTFAPGAAVIVGDSEIDICAGHVLHVPSIAVLTGIRSRFFLEEWQPTHISVSLAEATAELLAPQQFVNRQIGPPFSSPQPPPASRGH
jgi:phosphoglycolate phosphatase-like HAD superfamily hydrolase